MDDDRHAPALRLTVDFSSPIFPSRNLKIPSPNFLGFPADEEFYKGAANFPNITGQPNNYAKLCEFRAVAAREYRRGEGGEGERERCLTQQESPLSIEAIPQACLSALRVSAKLLLASTVVDIPPSRPFRRPLSVSVCLATYLSRYFSLARLAARPDIDRLILR